jgi:hypothetical protein
MEFEVFIPSNDPDGFDVTLRIGAENWMRALKLGLERTCGDQDLIRNVMCDIQADDVIHVTDMASGRIFVIKQFPASSDTTDPADLDITEPIVPRKTEPIDPPVALGVSPHPKSDEPIDSEIVAAATEPTSVEDKLLRSAPLLKAGSPLGIIDGTGLFRTIGQREIKAAAGDDGARILQETVNPTSHGQQAIEYASTDYGRVTDAAIEDVFLEINELFEAKTLEEAVTFSLDLAMRHVDAESGAVAFADERGIGLYFAAARGPKADELLASNFEIPIDKGIVGFVTREGISLTVSDVSRDPRFYKDISAQLKYPVESIVCSPLQCEGRSWGAIELMNHQKRPAFSGAEMNVLTYIGHQTGRFILNLLAR